MKNFNIILFFAIMFALPSITVALNESPVMLKRDPFDHPVLFVKRPKSKTNSKSVVGRAVELKLRATLVAGKSSMANVNGVLLKLGETIKGYRLLLVREREAVLEKKGKKVVIIMDSADLQKAEIKSKPKK
jgi:hypothetical protein